MRNVCDFGAVEKGTRKVCNPNVAEGILLGGRGGAGGKQWWLEGEVRCCCKKYQVCGGGFGTGWWGETGRVLRCMGKIWTLREVLVSVQTEIGRAGEKVSVFSRIHS